MLCHNFIWFVIIDITEVDWYILLLIFGITVKIMTDENLPASKVYKNLVPLLSVPLLLAHRKGRPWREMEPYKGMICATPPPQRRYRAFARHYLPLAILSRDKGRPSIHTLTSSCSSLPHPAGRTSPSGEAESFRKVSDGYNASFLISQCVKIKEGY